MVQLIAFKASHLNSLWVQTEQTSTILALKKNYGDLASAGRELMKTTILLRDNVPCIYTIFDEMNDEPIGCFGINHINANTAEAWALFGNKIQPHGSFLYRELRNILNKADIPRIQAFCDTGYPRFETFLIGLGFEKEGTLHKYGHEGQDQHIFWYKK